MVPELELKLAMLWWRILHQEPRCLFGTEAAKLRNSSWGDEIPQPGYVGGEYESHGIAFVSMNPGGSQGDRPGSTDEKQLVALRHFRECAEVDAPHAFPKVMRVLEEVMPTWSIYRNFVAPVLQCARLRLSQVAYLNLFKWRTQQGAALERLYELSWKHHTREQFNLLEPGFVISIGVGVGRQFQRLDSSSTEVHAIPRIRNNIGRAGRQKIIEICARLATGRQERRPTTGLS